jgi:topoisomerase-4 subunit B
VAVLPGKLTDCESRDLLHNEVFLVEGDGRRQRQDGPRQGDPGRAAAARQGAQHLGGGARPLFANNEIHDIAVAIGVDPHGPNDEPDLQRPALRQGLHPVDADVDGSHIQVLLLTLFFRHFPQADRAGHIYIAVRRCSASTRRRAARSRRPSSTRWTKASSTPRWTSCARKARAKAAGPSAASRAWAR